MDYKINESNFERQKILAANTNRLARKHLSAFEFSKAPKILDLGCGLGYTTRELADIFDTEDCLGLDLNPILIEKARQLSQASHSKTQYQTADAHQLPFEDQHFDLVYCRFLMLHVPRPAEVLAEMARVCKPGGKIMVQDFDLLSKSGLYPASWAYEKMVEAMNHLYHNPQIGRQLPMLFRSLNLQPKVRSDVFLISNVGLSKKLMTLTAEAMLPAMLANGILAEGEQEQLIKTMRAIEESSEYDLLTNPIITVWAEK